MLERVLSAWFRREEINGNGRCPTYLFRWTLFQPRWAWWPWKGFGIYLHKFVGDDWSRDLHDHPKRFISIGLKGSYIEITPSLAAWELDDEPRIYPCGCSHHKVEYGLCDLYSQKRRTFRAPWVRSFPASHIHRIELPANRRPCWTLVIVLQTEREWGFWHRGMWMHWKNYVHPDNTIADERKACH
jgi:hypothetical protein